MGRDTRHDITSVRESRPFWLAPGRELRPTIFTKEVIKWIIAVLANGVETLDESRRADAWVSHPTRDHTHFLSIVFEHCSINELNASYSHLLRWLPWSQQVVFLCAH